MVIGYSYIKMNETPTPADTEISANSDNHSSPDSVTGKFSRRKFLKFAAAGAASLLLPPTIKVASDPEVQAGIGAALTRPEQLMSSERNEISFAVLQDAWKKHFQDIEHLLPEKAWVRESDSQGEQRLEGTGVYLSIFAHIFYENETGEKPSLDEYYLQFVDSLHQLANSAELDFITLATTLQISAENIGGLEKSSEGSDLELMISRIQEVGITGARSLGIEHELIRALGPNGLFIRARNSMVQSGLSVPAKIDAAIPKTGIPDYDLIRFRQQPTIGMMDMEPSERASAFMRYQELPLAKQFEKEYHEVADVYRKVHTKTTSVEEVREELRKLASIYIEKYSHRLKLFAEGDTSALAAIGIAPEMDSWQLQNYTDVWYKASEIPTNPEYTYQRTVEYMKDAASKDPSSFYKRLFSQQIRNPKFLQYLTDQALEIPSTDEIAALKDIIEKLQVFDSESKLLRTLHMAALQAEGSHEYNSRFQQMTSVLVTKRLSDLAGDFNQNDRESLGWHIYKVCAIREIAPIPLLASDDCYARDITIDPPYAPSKLSKSLDEFTQMLVESGILNSDPTKNMYSAYQAIEKMYWRDGGVWQNTTKDQWDKVLKHFNTNLVNRLFYDFAGLLDNDQVVSELGSIMMEKGLITRPAKDDPYDFCTQLVYLQLDSRHMRHDIDKADWDEIKQYYDKYVRPIVYTDRLVAPGVHQEQYLVGSADYPPIKRAQAVLFNFLIDKQPVGYKLNLSTPLLGSYGKQVTIRNSVVR